MTTFLVVLGIITLSVWLILGIYFCWRVFHEPKRQQAISTLSDVDFVFAILTFVVLMPILWPLMNRTRDEDE